MKWINNLKIKTRLLLCFVLIALLTGILGGVSIYCIQTVNSAGNELYRVDTHAIDLLGTIGMDYHRTRVSMRDAILESSADKIKSFVDQGNGFWNDMNSLLPELDKAITSPEAQKEYENLKNSINQFTAVQTNIFTLATNGKDAEAVAALRDPDAVKLVTAIMNSIDNLYKLEETAAADKARSNSNMANLSTIITVIVLAVAVFLSILLGLIVSSSINRPLKKMVDAAEHMALGGVDVSIRAETKDEIGHLMESFEKVVENVKSQAAAASEIAAGNLSLDLKPKSDVDVLGKSMCSVIDTLRRLVAETEGLTRAAIEGRLNARGNTEAFSGGYRDILRGINQTLDAVIEPVREASAVLKELSRGNLSVQVNGNYKGDHAEIKDSLNHTINILSRYIGEISRVLSEISGGNLDIVLNEDYAGDFVQIRDSLNFILQSLNDAMSSIGSAAEQVSNGARHVSDSSQALSQGSAEQASSVEEITSALTEIAAQTKQNAVSANQANDLSAAVQTNASQGNHRMKEMLKAMEEINESSGNISKIIKVIDEISFQTNMLALNAAVEAARAGQHGKGFAVVAEEVRNLAAKSANAAKETTTLIEGSIHKVEAGTRIANETAEALGKIVEGVSQTSTLIGSIAAASNDQASAITQVNQGINQVSQVTQTNTATAEQSAAASEELSSQSELLKDTVRRFRLKNTSHGQVNKSNMSELSRALPASQNRGTARETIRPASNREAAAGTQKININLDDRDFGKY